MKKARVLRLLCLASILGSPVPLAWAGGEQAFIDRFDGSWSGSGTIITGAVTLKPGCRTTGERGVNHMRIEGTCSVFVISVRIGADITYDPASGRYNGTYIGAKVGPAAVVGKRSGDTVNLTITWPKPVYGDTSARMAMKNTGDGSLRLTIFDNVAPDGPEVRTTDIVLSRK